MTNPRSYRIGDTVRAHVRLSAHAGGGIVATGEFCITQIRGARCYVTWVSGARYPMGIQGWDNQWFMAGDDLVERV